MGDENWKRVVIVDDEPAYRDACSQALEAIGCLCELCGSVTEVLDLVPEHLPDLVVSDLEMPGQDGLDLLRELALLTPSVPVLIMTGRNDEQTRRSVLAAGAAAFIGKPFTFQELEDAVRAALTTSTEDL